MTPLKIGACLKAVEIDTHRDWLFDAGRDIEIQDFMSHSALTTDLDDLVVAAKSALPRARRCGIEQKEDDGERDDGDGRHPA